MKEGMMLIHADGIQEQLQNGRVVTTALEAVPFVMEVSGHPCGVCVTLHMGVGISNEGEGFGLTMTRVFSQLDDLCAQLGYSVSDLTWRTSAFTAPAGMMVLPSPGREDNTACRSGTSFSL
jgi:hypothetical protein